MGNVGRRASVAMSDSARAEAIGFFGHLAHPLAVMGNHSRLGERVPMPCQHQAAASQALITARAIGALMMRLASFQDEGYRAGA